MYENNLMYAYDFKIEHNEMNWISALIYFNDLIYFNVQKIYLLYLYSDRYHRKIFSY